MISFLENNGKKLLQTFIGKGLFSKGEQIKYKPFPQSLNLNIGSNEILACMYDLQKEYSRSLTKPDKKGHLDKVRPDAILLAIKEGA